VGRRREDGLLDHLFWLLKHMPVWVGPVLAICTFVLFRYLLPLAFSSPEKGPDYGVFFRMFLPMVAWIFALTILLLWVVAEASKAIDRRRLDVQTGLASIRKLSWQDFEHLVAEAYRRKGYRAQTLGSPSGDGGVDIELTGTDGAIVLVQCKHWRAYKVGVSKVRELLGGVVSRGATRGILVTSGRFTREALLFGEQNRKIEMVDGAQLTQLIDSVRHGPAATGSTNGSTGQGTADAPPCPICGATMLLRTARRGLQAGKRFWGCPRYPACRGIRPAS
jgi:restriction system protein